jgi:hypothetical protein
LLLASILSTKCEASSFSFNAKTKMIDVSRSARTIEFLTSSELHINDCIFSYI